MKLWLIIRPLYLLLTPFKKRMSALVVLTVLSTFLEVFSIVLVVPLLTLMSDPTGFNSYGPLADFKSSVSMSDRDFGIVLAAVFGVIVIISSVARYSLMAMQTNFSFSIGSYLATKMFDGVICSPLEWHQRTDSSDVVSSIVTKTQDVVNHIVVPLLVIFSSVISFFGILIFLIFLNPSITALMFAVLSFVYIAISITTKKRLEVDGKQVSKLRNRSVAALIESWNCIREIKLAGIESRHLSRFSSIDSNMRQSSANIVRLSQAPRYFVESFAICVLAISAMFFVDSASSITAVLPVLAALALSAQRMLPLIQQIYFSLTQLRGGEASFLDVKTYLDLEGEVRLGSNSIDFKNRISLEDVAVEYQGAEKHAIQSINLIIEKGERVGFIGATGSGKTTLTDALMGLIQPTSGLIVVDGVPVNKSNLIDWRRKFALVSQKVYLANLSIAENITYGTADKDIDYVWLEKVMEIAALKGGGLDETKLYNEKVGEDGKNLSGGQKQRVAVARALYRKPEILVLDEATSALDKITERQVIQRIEEAMREVTIISIAHRYEALRYCSKIYRLENGVVCDCVSYAEVEGR